MAKMIQSDERSEWVAGKLSSIFLGLTQMALLLLIAYQRYIENLPPSYYNDLAIILGASVIGYWLLSFYLGGVLPKLSWQTLLGSYLGLALLIALPYTVIRGFPGKEMLITWAAVIFGGPGALIGAYALAAYLGQKRLDRISESE